MINSQIIFIVGPTAVGKSDIAMELAKRVDGEIVSCDSMQVYRECPIASNQPSLEQKTQVAHHCVGCVSVTDNFNVNRYQHIASQAIEDILSRQKIPIVVGGSGLYVNALLYGIFESQGADLELRDKLLKEAQDSGAEILHQRLAQLDPKSAEHIHPNNIKRVIRALEVCLTHQTPMSEIQKHRRGLAEKYSFKIFGISMERLALYDRINRRVLKMIEDGLIVEIQSLDDKNLSQTARYLIGVREIQGFLKGEWDLNHAVERMQLTTRHLAKRQMTWFRRDERIEWIKSDLQAVDKMMQSFL